MKKLLIALAFTLSLVSTAALAAININTASVDELAQLNGVGPAKATAIVDYREANGSFKTVSGLTQVSGIGDKTVAGLNNEAMVGESEGDTPAD